MIRIISFTMALIWTDPIPPVDPCKRYVCAVRVRTMSYVKLDTEPAAQLRGNVRTSLR